MHKIFFYNKFIVCLYMFRALLCSSSGGQNCIIQRLISSHSVGGRPVHRILLTALWHIPVAVCTVLNSWWWTERPSETCRVSFQNKIIWDTGASGWFHCRNILRFTALWMSNSYIEGSFIKRPPGAWDPLLAADCFRAVKLYLNAPYAYLRYGTVTWPT